MKETKEIVMDKKVSDDLNGARAMELCRWEEETELRRETKGRREIGRDRVRVHCRR